jgi:hypothetical protein
LTGKSICWPKLKALGKRPLKEPPKRRRMGKDKITK